MAIELPLRDVTPTDLILLLDNISWEIRKLAQDGWQEQVDADCATLIRIAGNVYDYSRTPADHAAARAQSFALHHDWPHP